MNDISRREREKLMREQEILSSAKRIFYLKGFEDASMDEIAKDAQFTKSTLYQYFENKEDLYFAVVLDEYKKLFSNLNNAFNSEQRGFMKIEQACKYFYKFYGDNPEVLRVISYQGLVRKKSVGKSKRRDELMMFNNNMFRTVAEVISEGISDGSVRPDLDAGMTAFSLIFLLTGFYNLLSVTGDSFTGHFSLDVENFSRFTMDILLRTLKKNGLRDGENET